MNAITIEQTSEETKLAISVHRSAAMNTIRLVRSRLSSDRPNDALKNPISLTCQVKSEHYEVSVGSLLIEVDFSLTGSNDGGKSKNKCPLSVECTFEATYRLQPDFLPSAEQVKACKDGNAIFNCWPYCRQYVQDAVQQMGYPPFTLPFLRVVTKRPRVQKVLESK